MAEAVKRDDQPMAIIRWEFMSPNGAFIHGCHVVRNTEHAIKIRDRMNREHGDGSHWVETLNVTWNEHRAQIAELVNGASDAN